MDEAMLMEVVRIVTVVVEITGIVIILTGAVISGAIFLRCLLRGDRESAYHGLRANLGRSILLGLELLVAGDIINTVAIEPTLHSLAILAGIVAIRTFLSFSLEVEIEGRWPWQGARKAGA